MDPQGLYIAQDQSKEFSVMCSRIYIYIYIYMLLPEMSLFFCAEAFVCAWQDSSSRQSQFVFAPFWVL